MKYIMDLLALLRKHYIGISIIFLGCLIGGSYLIYEYREYNSFRGFIAHLLGEEIIHHLIMIGSIPIFIVLGYLVDHKLLLEGKIMDLTKSQKKEELLRQKEEIFRHITESSPMGMHMYILEPGGRLVFSGANPAADKILGLANRQFMGKTIEEAFPSLVETEVPEKYKEVAEKGGTWNTEQVSYEDKKLSGAFDVQAFNISPGKMAAMFLDITERKKAEEELRFKHAQLLSLFDNINEVIYVSDPENYEIIYANRTLKNLLKKDPTGGKCYEEFQGFDSPCDFCTNERILKKKGEPYYWHYHNPIIGRDFKIMDKIINWPDGRDLRFEIAFDITDLKAVETELIKYTDELEEANKLKELFTDIMRHDLANPLLIINMFIERLLEEIESPSDDALEAIQAIKENNKIAIDLMDIACSYSKIESMKSIEMEELEIGPLLELIINKLKPLADVKDIRIDHQGTITGRIKANVIISDVFSNLLSNAIKFAPNSSTLTTYIKEDGNNFIISFKDRGPGIRDEYKKTIFERFVRGERAGVEGSGLGLAISKRIVDLHNGKIWVEDNPDGGSIFFVSLPKG